MSSTLAPGFPTLLAPFQSAGVVGSAVTWEPHVNQGRLTDLIQSGRLSEALNLPSLSPTDDRVMVCGIPAMLVDTRALLDARGFKISSNLGEPGDYVIEHAFVAHQHCEPSKVEPVL
jgi:ferredoxin-NADP reductase